MIGSRARPSGRSALLVAAFWSGGCAGGDARVEIAAADLLDATGQSLEQALSEYHAEIVADDDRRRHAVVVALARRLAAGADDRDAVQRHISDFEAALTKLRADAETEWVRYATSRDNVRQLHRASDALRKLAIDSLSLADETKRWLTDALVRIRRYRRGERADAGREGPGRVKLAGGRTSSQAR